MTLGVGFFDGVHLGHRRILAEADAAITFNVHPLSVLAPERAPTLLTTLDERKGLIEAALAPASGLSVRGGRVAVFGFDRTLAEASPTAFADSLVRRFPDLDTVRCGVGWRFGRGGAGDARLLRRLGLKVCEVPLCEFDGAPVSSSRIREDLAAGRLETANAMLGRPFSVSGRAVAGKGWGRRLGFPTVNLACDLAPGLLARGVYRVATALPVGRGVANWGTAPTAGDRAWGAETLEIHFPDAPADAAWPAAGDRLEVSFLGFVRPERKFASPAALREQIALDVSG